jgi:hypothetical protein
MPFDSAEAFRQFVTSVKHDRRYIYSTDVTSFLDAVEETAQSRIKTIPKGIHLWRAQLGGSTRLKDEGQPEEMEVDNEMSLSLNATPILRGEAAARESVELYINRDLGPEVEKVLGRRATVLAGAARARWRTPRTRWKEPRSSAGRFPRRREWQTLSARQAQPRRSGSRPTCRRSVRGA